MRPASRRALLRRLAAGQPLRGLGWGAALALGAAALFLLLHFLQRPSPPPAAAPAPVSPRTPIGDPALALPFGSAANELSAVTAGSGALAIGPNAELRAAYATVRDRLSLYRQLRARAEPDARYLAWRVARECSALLYAGDVAAGGGGARARQLALALEGCRGFVREPVAAEETAALLREAAAAGHAAARLAAALHGDSRPAAAAVDLIAAALASGDPLAFDEARALLAALRYEAVIGGVPPPAGEAVGRADYRAAALDLANCRLGNPCGPARGAPGVPCGSDAVCLREAQAWLLEAVDLDEDEARTADALAERLVAAFRRGDASQLVRPAR